MQEQISRHSVPSFSDFICDINLWDIGEGRFVFATLMRSFAGIDLQTRCKSLTNSINPESRLSNFCLDYAALKAQTLEFYFWEFGCPFLKQTNPIRIFVVVVFSSFIISFRLEKQQTTNIFLRNTFPAFKPFHLNARLFLFHARITSEINNKFSLSCRIPMMGTLNVWER